MKLFTALAVATASITTVANAQTERDLDSHEHGAATLNVAIDETAVFIELDTPWDNLVGFEHAPQSDDQQALVDQALSTLNQPDQLFLFAGGDCTISEVDIDSPLTSKDADGHGDEHSGEHSDGHDDKHSDEHSDGHDDKHSDEHSDGHGDEHSDEHSDGHDDAHGHDHDESESETHSTAVVTYTYSCANTASIASIDVKLFDVWSGFNDLDVQLIGPGGQALAELASGQSLLDISRVQ